MWAAAEGKSDELLNGKLVIYAQAINKQLLILTDRRPWNDLWRTSQALSGNMV